MSVVKLIFPVQSSYIASLCCFVHVNIELEEAITVSTNKTPDLLSVVGIKNLYSELFHLYKLALIITPTLTPSISFHVTL